MAYYQCGRNILRRIGQDTGTKGSNGYLPPLFFTGQGVRYRKLEVILTTNMDKLGKAGETVKVAPGYFRNYLMPKLLAVPNIDKFAYLVKEQRKIYQPLEEEEVKVEKESKQDLMKEYIAAAKRLDNGTVVGEDTYLEDFALEGILTHSPVIVFMALRLESSKRPHVGWLNACDTVLNGPANERQWLLILVFRRYFKVDNELREPVTKDEIIAEVARQLSVQVEPENLHMPNPLSSLGEHEIPLRLPKSIPMPQGKLMWSLKVKIRRK